MCLYIDKIGLQPHDLEDVLLSIVEYRLQHGCCEPDHRGRAPGS